MIYYFLPSPGIYGGVKVAFQFSQMLRELGIPVVVATPSGNSPSWFYHCVPTTDRKKVLAELKASDVVLFSLPHDYVALKSTGAKLIFHCQGTDPLIDPIVRDESVLKLTCWQQAQDYFEQRSADAIEVGISISSEFFYSGERKMKNSVSYMSRKVEGSEFLGTFDKNWYLMDGLRELEVAEMMKRSEGFIATVSNEWFGLPALEAMASANLVVSPPTIGGTEYLEDGVNCAISTPDLFAMSMRELLYLSESTKEGFRNRAFESALAYHPSVQRIRLRTLISESELGKFLCG